MLIGFDYNMVAQYFSGWCFERRRIFGRMSVQMNDVWQLAILVFTDDLVLMAGVQKIWR